MVLANLTMKETARGRFTLQRLPFKNNVNDQSPEGKYDAATSDYSLSPDEPSVHSFLTASGTLSKQQHGKLEDGENATTIMRRFSGSLNIPKAKERVKVTDLNWKVKGDKIAHNDENADPTSIMNNNKFILEDLKRLRKVEKQLRQELENARGNVSNTNHQHDETQVPALQAELNETRQMFKNLEGKLKKQEDRAERYFSENVRLHQECNQKVQELISLQNSFENLSGEYENLKTSQFSHEQKWKEMEENLERQKSHSDILKMKLRKLHEETQQNMNTKLDRLSSAYENLSKEHEHLKTLHLSLESKFKEVSEKAQVEKERFKGLNTKYQELRNQKQSESESNRKILDDLSQAHIEIIKVNQKIEATAKAEQQSKNEIRRLNETIRELNSAYHDLYSKCNLTENEKNNVKGQNEQLAQEISTLQKSLEVKQKELEQMETAISGMISPAEHRSTLRVLEYYRNLVQTDAESSKHSQARLKGRMQEIQSLEQKVELLAEENAKLRQRCQLYEAKYESLKEMYDQLNAASWMEKDGQTQATEPLYESILEVEEIDPSELAQGAVGGSTTFIEYKTCPFEPSCNAVFTRTRHLKHHIREKHPGLIE